MLPRGQGPQDRDRDRRPWTRCMLGLVLLLALLALCPMAFYWGVHLERTRAGRGAIGVRGGFAWGAPPHRELLSGLCPCRGKALEAPGEGRSAWAATAPWPMPRPLGRALVAPLGTHAHSAPAAEVASGKAEALGGDARVESAGAENAQVLERDRAGGEVGAEEAGDVNNGVHMGLPRVPGVPGVDGDAPLEPGAGMAGAPESERAHASGGGQGGPIIPNDHAGQPALRSQPGIQAARSLGNSTRGALRGGSDNGSLSLSARKRARELPVEEVLAQVGGPERMLIWGTASMHYLDLLHNWFLSVQRVGYGHKVLFVAEDQVSLNFLLGRWPNQTVSGMNLCAEAKASWARRKIPLADTAFGKTYYMALVDRRPEYFKALLERNYSILYNDVDMVWVGDPFPFFRGSFDAWVQEDGVSFEGALEQFKAHIQGPNAEGGGGLAMPLPLPFKSKRGYKHGLCTCFIMARPTPPVIELMHLWSAALKQEVNESGASVLNQPAFNSVVNSLLPGEINLAVLPVGSFPSGCLYFRRPKRRLCKVPNQQYWQAVDAHQATPVVVHNNWVKGHKDKVQAFKSMNLWLLPLGTRIKPWGAHVLASTKPAIGGVSSNQSGSEASERTKNGTSHLSASSSSPTSVLTHPPVRNDGLQEEAGGHKGGTKLRRLKRVLAHRERSRQLWAERWRKDAHTRSKSSRQLMIAHDTS